ncbi:AAA family ATPase [Brasilonema bromeliae]|uniref:MoxR family ATPase n=1 Tax=Brasilonema bromeliae SPC951 TaxID=385972 RepID=A0ABX1PB81_9CYAN|nr:MoxR family ATPase [Brasilonema bromeliae]NMG21233.1 MoxR family ATPase [Brasilonema bromeliae SPC951]
MSKRSVDTSTKYSTIAYESLPDSLEVEDSEVDPVSEKDPPKKKIYKEPYLPDKKLAEAVDLAIALGRPLLLQGEPGCGKTRLAYAVAYALGLPLEVSYIKSTSRAQDLLYTYDAVNRLYDAQLGADGPCKNGIPLSRDIGNYIRLGPLGRAIARAQYERRSVVLIDEIDKADLDFPNDLLWELDRLEFRVTEAPDIYYAVGDNPALRPIVFVTHNEEKALPTAFLRRCIFHYVEFPQTEELLQQVLATHEISNQQLSEKAIKVLLKLRGLDLSKRPGLSELLDWVGYLEAVKTPVEELDKLPYLGTLLKQESDRQRAITEYPKQ